jgi:hypothetical protein
LVFIVSTIGCLKADMGIDSGSGKTIEVGDRRGGYVPEGVRKIIEVGDARGACITEGTGEMVGEMLEVPVGVTRKPPASVPHPPRLRPKNNIAAAQADRNKIRCSSVFSTQGWFFTSHNSPMFSPY